MGTYTSTISGGGVEFDRRMAYLSSLEQYYSAPVGIQWESTSDSPVLQHIDINGDNITLGSSYFAQHPVYAGIRTCTRNRTTGAITYGTTNAGAGLTLDGTTGDVLVEIPTAKYKFAVDGNYYQWFIIPEFSTYTGFTAHPSALQRGGTERAKIWIGAKESYGYLDGSTFKLGSAAGQQPITGEVSYTDLPNTGRLTMTDAETYANNIATGFGICNIWTWAYLRLLMYIEYGTFSLQTALGKGTVLLSSGTGFAGLDTGADSIDSNLNYNGTGKGTGTDGSTPISWRGIENPWGNVWEFIIGLNINTDGSYNILKSDGTGTPATTLASGSYESGTGFPTSADGFISGLQSSALGGRAFLPSANVGTNATYLCDQYWIADYNPSIVRVGGGWADGYASGIGAMTAGDATTASGKNIGCRLEYLP